MMSIKDLVFKEKQVRKLTERYIGSYIIKEVMSANVVILRLLIWRKLAIEQRVKKLKLIEMNEEKE